MTATTAEGPLRARVDPDDCFAFGFCLSSLPDVFRLGEDGKAHALDVDADEEALRAAVDDCPRGAISLRRGDAAT